MSLPHSCVVQVHVREPPTTCANLSIKAWHRAGTVSAVLHMTIVQYSCSGLICHMSIIHATGFEAAHASRRFPREALPNDGYSLTLLRCKAMMRAACCAPIQSG